MDPRPSLAAATLSYRKHYDCAPVHVRNCDYVSTIVVDRRFRGARLAYDLYGELFYEASFDGAPVVTRTWKSESHEHSNDAHLHILSELGFKERKVLTGDRGPGIERLDFDKQLLLYERIEGAERRVWASGYRHILTSSLTAALRRAANRGIEIRILCAPPWSEGFRAVYGNDAESVAKLLVNYVKIFRSVLLGEDGHLEGAHCTVRFTHNVIFNDIYCVDDTFVTSPYSYASENTDGPHAQATAREFFTLVVSDDSRLHRLTGQEFEDLWDNAPEELDKERFAATFASTEYMSHAGPDFMERLRSCLDEREGDGRAKAVPIPMPSDAIDD